MRLNFFRLFGLAGLGLITLLLPGAATADQYLPSSCSPGSFSDYLYAAPCTAGTSDLLLYNFDLFRIDGNNQLQAPDQALLDSLMITPVWNQTEGTLQLTVGGFAPVAADETASYQIGFTVDPAPVLAGESVSMDPPFGNVVGTQYYCSDESFNTDFPNLCMSETTPGQISFGIGNPASITFPQLLAVFTSKTNITLNPNHDTASGIDALVFSFQTTEASAPEPATWGLIALGLVTFRLTTAKRRTGLV